MKEISEGKNKDKIEDINLLDMCGWDVGYMSREKAKVLTSQHLINKFQMGWRHQILKNYEGLEKSLGDAIL